MKITINRYVLTYLFAALSILTIGCATEHPVDEQVEVLVEKEINVANANLGTIGIVPYQFLPIIREGKDTSIGEDDIRHQDNEPNFNVTSGIVGGALEGMSSGAAYGAREALEGGGSGSEDIYCLLLLPACIPLMAIISGAGAVIGGSIGLVTGGISGGYEAHQNKEFYQIAQTYNYEEGEGRGSL